MLRLAPFQYVVPADLAEAVATKKEYGGRAMFVAGGTDLLPNMKRGQQNPEVLIQVRHLPGLDGVERESDGGLRIGAMTTLTEVASNRIVQEGWAALSTAAGKVATPILRNLATLGGNLCLDTRCNFYDQSHEWRESIGFCMKERGETCWVAPSSPRCWAVQSSDTAPLAVALGARIELHGPSGSRTVAAGEFYHDDGIRYLAKEEDELVTAVLFPGDDRSSAAYRKVSRRGSFDFPILGVAVWISRETPTGPVLDARIVLGAIASSPLVVDQAAESLVGRPLDESAIEDAADIVANKARPMDNTDLTGSWRKKIVRPTVVRALRELGS